MSFRGDTGGGAEAAGAGTAAASGPGVRFTPTADPARSPVAAVLAIVVAGALLLAPQAGLAQSSSTALLFRIFLRDGRTMTSYGEYARLGDRVVFSMPLGGQADNPRLHLTSIPADQVDWTATDRYRDALRATHYADTRGEQDFAAMSTEIARLLNEIAISKEPAAQLKLAERALGILAGWPRLHYGYRSEEVRQIQALVEEVVSDLRAKLGESRFDLNLVTGVAPPPPVPLLPPPSLKESIEQALTAAALADSPNDRTSLLQSALVLLNEGKAALPKKWVNAAKADATRALNAEIEVTRAYTDLRARALDRAARAAAAADVRGVERALADVRKRDAKLGMRRPEEVAALVAALEGRLDAARRYRLALDQWNAKEEALRAYRDAVRKPLDELARARPVLEDIRTLAGPERSRLASFRSRINGGLDRARRISPPADARAVHGILTSALQMAESAARLRQDAILSGDLKRAWDASAAAAGSLMLADRARADLERILQPPQLQ